MPRWQTLALVSAVSLVLTVVNQAWIGRATIYAPEREGRRELLHQAILRNQAPGGGTWSAAGANGVNTRIVVPWAAELIRRVSRRSLASVYFYLESAALFLALLLLFGFLRLVSGTGGAIAGLLLVGALLPLTYLHHYFHPWDKPSLVCWLLGLTLIRLNRPGWLALLLPVAVAVKQDIVLLPLLYLAAAATPANRERPLLVTAGLLALSFGTSLALTVLFPGGSEPRPALTLMADNIRTMLEQDLTWPPLLGLGLPLILALRGFRASDRFAQGAAGLALLQTGILFAWSHFVEFRAEVPVLILLLPAALKGAETALSPNAGWGAG